MANVFNGIDAKTLEVCDTLLSILQRIAIVVAAAVAGYFVLLRGDNTFHIEMNATSVISSECVVTTSVVAQNSKGVPLSPVSIGVQVLEPDLREVRDTPAPKLLIAEQLKTTNGALKVGEKLSQVLYVSLADFYSQKQSTAPVTIRVELTLKGGIIYVHESFLEAKGCAQS